MKIAVGSDHRGFAAKERIKELLGGRGVEVHDFGTESTDSCDYPDAAIPTATAVADGQECYVVKAIEIDGSTPQTYFLLWFARDDFSLLLVEEVSVHDSARRTRYPVGLCRRGGRAAEGAPLLREYGLIPHRGFESLPLRQVVRWAVRIRAIGGL